MRICAFTVPKWLAYALCAVVLATCGLTLYRTSAGSNDFDTFYQAGRAVLKGGQIYYQGDYYQASATVSPFLYPPFAALFFAPWALLPALLSAVLWNIFLSACFVYSAALILEFLDITPAHVRTGWQKMPGADKLGLSAMGLALLLDNLSMAQSNIFIFFLCLVSLCLWKNNRQWGAGTVLAAAVWIKLTPLIFCLFFAAKRSWKTLGAFAAASALILGLTTVIFGADENRVLHRQWLGRTIKPAMAGFLQKVMPKEDPHPQKKNWDQLAMIHLGEVFADKNQSLESMLTRLFLKNRNGYAFSEAYPMINAQRYYGLPVIAKGLPLEKLSLVLQVIRAALALLLLLACLPRASARAMLFLQVSAVFLGMTLFAPLARTYQFVSFIFFYAFFFIPELKSGNLKIPFRISVLCYAGMAFLYGRAAGTGMWANLVLFGAVLFEIIRNLKHQPAECRA